MTVISYNETDSLFEVSVSRSRLKELIEFGIHGMRSIDYAAAKTINYDERVEALQKVGETASRVLAGVSKYFGNDGYQCGCPAILAQVNSGASYHDIGLGSYTSFANTFDMVVGAYIDGLLDVGVEYDAPEYANPRYSKIRLIVTGEDS